MIYTRIDLKGLVIDLRAKEGWNFREYHTRKFVKQKVKEAGPSLFRYLMKAITFAYCMGDRMPVAEAERAANAFFRAFNKQAATLSYYVVGPKYKKLRAKEYYQLLTSEIGNSPVDCYRELLEWERDDHYKHQLQIDEMLIRSVFKAQRTILAKLADLLSVDAFITEDDVDDLVTNALREM